MLELKIESNTTALIMGWMATSIIIVSGKLHSQIYWRRYRNIYNYRRQSCNFILHSLFVFPLYVFVVINRAKKNTHLLCNNINR